MKKPVLNCARCGARPRLLPWTVCLRCYGKDRSRAAKISWNRRRRDKEARLEADQLPAIRPRPDLEKLALEADRAGAKALELARSIAARFGRKDA
jgi:hypothetical protein